MLVKTCYTGIATSLIGGQTTHKIVTLGAGSGKQTMSAETKEKAGELLERSKILDCR
jgi:hypothetical protein